ncbi:MAG: thioesterase family protein [Acidimicrobiia bacterium]
MIQGREEFAFEEDTAVEAGGENLYIANITDRWSIGGRPNGGYLMGTILTALSHRLTHPHPLTSTGHFLSPAEPGPAEIKVNVIKEGRSLSTAQAVLSQNGRDRLAALATFGVLADEGVTRVAENAPVHGDDLVSSIGRPIPFPIVERFVFEMPPEQSRAAAGQPDHTEGPAEFVGRIRFADGMPASPLAIPLLVDAFPPTVFRLGLIGWTPTLELTVHTRGLPVPGPLTLRVRSRFLINGLAEEDGELWDQSGALVGQSRQLAKIIV